MARHYANGAGTELGHGSDAPGYEDNDSAASPYDKQLAFFRLRLRKAMGVKGIDAATLADAAGIARSTVSRYLSGTCYPTSPQLIRLSRYLNIPTDWLLGFSMIEIEQHFKG